MVAFEPLPIVSVVPLSVNPPVPLNKYVGLLLPPQVIAFAFPVPILSVAAPPVSNVSPLAPLDCTVNAPTFVGVIVEPSVILPFTVSESSELVDPVNEN